jgi:hypothetical protein
MSLTMDTFLCGKDFRAIVQLVLDSDANSLHNKLVLVKVMSKSLRQAFEKCEAAIEGLMTASDSTLEVPQGRRIQFIRGSHDSHFIRSTRGVASVGVRDFAWRGEQFGFEPVFTKDRHVVFSASERPIDPHTHLGRKIETAISYLTAPWLCLCEQAFVLIGKVGCFFCHVLKLMPSTEIAKLGVFGPVRLSSHTIFFAFKAAILCIHLHKGSPREFLTQIRNREASRDPFFG